MTIPGTPGASLYFCGDEDMRKELTITIAEDVYTGLHQVMDEAEISGFIEALVRPHVPSVGGSERSIVELLAMPEACGISFDPPRLDTELYRKSDAV